MNDELEYDYDETLTTEQVIHLAPVSQRKKLYETIMQIRSLPETYDREDYTL